MGVYQRHFRKKAAVALVTMISSALMSGVAFADDAMGSISGTAESPVILTNTGTIDNLNAQYDGTQGTYRFFYGMAVLSNAPGSAVNGTGDYGILTNNGKIFFHAKDIAARYGDQLKTVDDESKSYSAVMCRGMIAGKYSTLTNNGTLQMAFDQGENSSAYFYHAMYGGANSTVNNYGDIIMTGEGSSGTNVRGMIADADVNNSGNVKVNNYGTIKVDVDRAQLVRPMATVAVENFLTNYGTIYARSNGTNYGMSRSIGTELINNGKITVIEDAKVERGKCYGNFTQLTAAALGMTADGGGGVNNYKMINNGLIDVKVTGQYAEATDPALGFEFNSPGNVRQNVIGTWIAENTGVIRHSSDVQPSAENNYIVRSAEIGINLLPGAGIASPVQAKLGNWATELRDFGTTKDFIQTRWVDADPNHEHPINVDFSETKFILRPSANYKAGTAYKVSADTLITDVNGETGSYTATGMDSVTFASEAPELVAVNAEKTGDGEYTVSLTPANDSETAKNLLNAMALFPVDFTRATMDRLDYELETNKNSKWFITPYYTKLNRSGGIGGKNYGYIGGSNWKFGKKLNGGIHLAYSLGNGDGNSSRASMKGVAGGVHMTYTPQADKNWIRGQITYMKNEGDLSRQQTMVGSGITLNGKRSAASNNIYAALTVGQKNTLSKVNSLSYEFGLSYLNVNNNAPITWDYFGAGLEGYTMGMDRYNAAYATLKGAWTHKFSPDGKNGQLRFSLGARARLSAKEMGMTAMQVKYNDTVREDPAQALIGLSYNRALGRDCRLNLGYQGILGKDAKNHGFFASFKAML